MVSFIHSVLYQDVPASQWEVPGVYFHAGDRMGQLAWDWSCGYKSIYVPHGSTVATSNFYSLTEPKQEH